MASKVINGYEACMEELANKRCMLKGMDKHLFPCGGPRPKTLIEISGASGSGKSILLWQLMARCLLPTQLGGCCCDVVFIDLGHKFDALHFEDLLRREVRESGGEQHSPIELDSCVDRCLASLSVLNCYKPDDYTIALEAAETTLLQNANCALLAIDGIDLYYWLDSCKYPLRMQTHYKRSVERLRRLCERHNVCCAYTVNAHYLEVKKYDARQVRNKWPPSEQADYSLRLQRIQGHKRNLNGFPISIADGGIYFDDL